MALNDALLSPAPMLTLVGTLTLVLLLDRLTLTALEAAALNVTMQAEVPGPFNVDGEQVRLLS